MSKYLILFITVLFFINQRSAAQCSGTPAAGTIVASQPSSCVPFLSNLSLSGTTSDAGITYQWYSSTDGFSFSPVGGATNATYTAGVAVTTYYYVLVTCTNSGLSATTPTQELTINTLASNTGTPTVCAGFSTDLDNITPGGVWSSSNTSIADVNAVTGVVTGVGAGTATVSYTTGPGCSATTVVTVNSLPPAISGVPSACEAGTTTLTNSATGGTWTSSNTMIATVNPITGVVTGVAASTVNITYTAPTGCFNIRNITVNPLPAAITGTPVVCAGATTNFSNGTPGGAWTSSNYGVATVGVVSGIVSGLSSGTANISYTLVLTGCSVSRTVTVNPTPTPISGTGHVCIGQTATLIDAIGGGSWSSSNTAVATITSAGVVSGLTLGTSVISYTLPGTGCAATLVATVQPLPTVYNVTGGGSYCIGGAGVNVGLDNSTIGVTYMPFTDTSTASAAVGTGAPIGFGLITPAGTYSVMATNSISGCQNIMAGTATVVITPLTTPSVAVTTLIDDTVCEGTVTTFTPDPFYGGPAPTYLWKVNGTLVSSSDTYTFVPANGDSVTVVMTSNADCPSPDTAVGSMKVTVLPYQMPAVTTSVYPDDTVCQHNLVTLTPTPIYGGAAPFYMWYVNGSLHGVGDSLVYAPANGDIVNVKMESNYRCPVEDTVTSGNVTLTVVPLVVPFVNITSANSLSIKMGELDTLTATVIGGGPAPSYQWLINDVVIPGATSSTFISSFNHNDSVSVIVTSSGICFGISTFDWVFITITNVGVSPLAAITDVQLLPNPNNGTFTVRGHLASPADEAVILEVTDMIGQVVYRNSATAKGGRLQEQITTGNLSNGMYMLHMRTAGDQKTFHFVVEQ